MKNIYINIAALFLCVLSFSCKKESDDKNKKSAVKNIKEIEINNNSEYSQFIESDVKIKAEIINKENEKDIDYYKLSPTNGWIFSLDIEYEKNAYLTFELSDKYEEAILTLNTSDFEKHITKIKFPYFIFDDSYYYLKVFSDTNYYKSDKDENIKYDITINYKKDYLEYEETEPNHKFENAVEILSPNTKHKGFFIKTSDYKDLANTLQNYINIDNVVDIDIYKIENSLSLNSLITVNLEYAKANTKIILFDENYNFITSSSKKAEAYFPPDTKIYALVFLEDSKSGNEPYFIYYTLQ